MKTMFMQNIIDWVSKKEFFKKAKKRNFLTGFTLVEVLVSTAIFVGISTVIIGAYIGCQRSFITGTVLLDLHGQTRQSLDWARKDIEWAIVIENSRSISGKTYTTGDNVLVLRIPSINNLMNLTGSVDYVVYHLNDDDPAILERVVAPDASSARPGGIYIIARNVSALNFSSGGTGLGSVGILAAVRNITIRLTTAKTVLGSRVLQSNAVTSILMRNF
ncbi:MAG: hypothetical protein V1739_04250 [Candidatus Omnitrophota bacterium]